MILFKNVFLLKVLCFSVAVVCFFFDSSKAQNAPLSNAFSHNDYQHKQPLFEAINNGYTYIEADVYIHKDQLVVTHVLPIIHHSRKLESLYLQPLANYIQKNNGQVYPGFTGPFTLMIDIKSDPKKSYQLLKPILEKYRGILSGYQNGIFQAGAVRIVLSGHKPAELLQDDKDRLAFLDEDLRKINRDTTNAGGDMLAMASCKYSKLLKWKGSGELSIHEKKRLADYVDLAHRCGAKVRLWSSPDNQVVWKQLLQCGVDLINTDKLTRLRTFLINDDHKNALIN